MLKIGHRGAAGLAPENTVAAMKKAMELGVDGFEFDIRLSKDGIPVVIHDETLERTTNGKGRVRDFNLAELQKFDAGNGEKIPTLAEVIKLVDKRCALFIELKDEDAVKPVVDMVTHAVKHDGWGYEQLFILSFNHHQLVEARAIDANIKTCASIVATPITLAQFAIDAGAHAMGPALDHATQELIDDAHTRGLKTFVWTVNKPESIARASTMKVSGIISDFPDRL